jgi:hypothetical protein
LENGVKTIQERFNSKIERIPGIDCWIWNAAQHQFGYGHIRYGNKIEVAHRVSYILHYGEIPEGKCVLHQCDVPQCVNPEHLFVGDTIDNINDRIKKNRSKGLSRPGALNPGVKLSESDVLAIRADNRPQKDIAKDVGISKTQVGRIKRNESWRTA